MKEYVMCAECGTIADYAYWEDWDSDESPKCPICNSEIAIAMSCRTDGEGELVGVEVRRATAEDEEAEAAGDGRGPTERGHVFIAVPVDAVPGIPTEEWFEHLRGQVKAAVARDDFEWDDYSYEEE